MSLTAEQLQVRATGIGGAEAAAALGLSKRQTMLELYMEKRGEFPRREPPDEEVIWWGRALEPVVRQKYAEKTGRTIVLPAGSLVSEKHPFMVGHVDGLIYGEHRGYEGKTAYQSTGWGEEGTDEIPADYLLQVHHYLTLTEYEVWDVCVLIGRKFAIYEVPYDREMSEMLIAGEADFMRRIREGDPPALDFNHSTAIDVVKKLYPGTDGRRIDASLAAIDCRKQLEDAQLAKKNVEAAAQACKARLLEEMGEAAILAFPDGKAYRRQLTQRAGYTVAPTEYMDARFVNDGKAAALKRA
jgi:putative phage-type endonuclease